MADFSRVHKNLDSYYIPAIRYYSDVLYAIILVHSVIDEEIIQHGISSERVMIGQYSLGYYGDM